MVNLIKEENTNSTKELTKSLADDIVNSFLKYGTAKKVFTAEDTDYDYKNVLKVDAEIDRVVVEIKSRLSGSFVVESSIPATYDVDDNGDSFEVTAFVPAVYYAVTTETKLLGDIDSFLTVKNILDYLKDGSTWTAYKDSFKQEDLA